MNKKHFPCHDRQLHNLYYCSSKTESKHISISNLKRHITKEFSLFLDATMSLDVISS